MVKEDQEQSPQLESVLQRRILNYARTMPGVVCFKVMLANENGVPDLLCCVNGKFVAVEIKGSGGKVSSLQKAQMDRITKAGGVAVIVRTLGDFINLLGEQL